MPVLKKPGFSNREEFINEAVRERILELKKKEFIQRSDKIKERLESIKS